MMKSLRRPGVSILLVLVTMWPCGAQQSAGANTDALREKIQQMEVIDVKSMSPSVLEIYKRTLLRMYELFTPALDQQIDNLTRMLGLVNETQADPHGDVANERQKLINEKQQVKDKINVLKSSLQLSDAGGTKTNVKPAQPSKTGLDIKPMSNLPPPGSKTSSPDSKPPTLAKVQNCPDANKFTNAPPVLIGLATRVARNIVNPPDPTLSDEDRIAELSSAFYEMLFYTVASAIGSAMGDSINNIEPYRYLYETARTDKQMGSSASSSAATTAVEKPGFATWLGIAVENGQIEQAVDVDGRDTILTLSTSPVVLFSFNKDRTRAYKDAGILNRVGLSSSFNISNQDQLLFNATRSQLREYSIRYRFLGDRSPRSPRLERIFDREIAPLLQARLNALGESFIFIDDDPVLGPLGNRVTELKAAVASRIQSTEYKTKSDKDKQVEDVTDTILCFMKSAVADPINKGEIRIDARVRERINSHLVPALASAQRKLEIVRKTLNEKLDEFFKGPLGTFAYVNHRNPLGNYSEAKVVYEQNSTFLNPFSLVGNAGLSFYHNPDPTKHQQRVRDLTLALSFEGKTDSPFTETTNLGKITFSFVGRYERMFENRHVNGRKADLASLQFLMDVPFYKGLAFPFSLTYSNATLVDTRKGWQANFGFKLDTDKLLELIRTAPER